MIATAIDEHPQKDVIVKRILDGMPVRRVVAGLVPSVSFATANRYRSNVIKPMMREAESLNRVLRANKDGEIVSRPAPVPLSNDTQATQTVQRAIEAAPALSIFRAGIDKLRDRIDRTLDKAESAQRVVDVEGTLVAVGADLAVLAPLCNQMHKNLELLGRATGELEPTGGSSVSIQIVLPGMTPEAEPRVSYARADAIEAVAVDGIVEIGAVQK